MNTPALITARPIERPNYMNAPVTLETFQRWFIANYYAMRRYWLELQECTGAQETAGEFLEWAHCQYDIAKRSTQSPSSPDGQHGRKSALCGAQHELSGEDSQAGSGTAGAGSFYPVTCRARYYDAASRILEDETNLFTHDNADELGHVIQKWIEETRNNWEPR
jgi:hypothetical protein